MNSAYEYVYDVVIVGAGTAGAAAAIAAADHGAKVLVVEQFGCAGGSGTVGLVTPLMSTHIKGNPQCSYVGAEINRRLAKENAGDGKECFFDPMMLSLVLEEMLSERGVTMLYHTMVTGVNVVNGHIESIHVCNISGNGIVRARSKYIDCTGDATVCDFAGLATLHGDEETHKNQPCSLRYLIDGIDTDAFWKYLTAMRGMPDAERPENYSDAVTLSSGPHTARCLDGVFEEAVKNGDLMPEDALYWQFFTVPGRKYTIAFNCPEFFDIDDIANARNQSYVQVEGKKRILRHLRFYRSYLPGFENAYISQISGMVGIRESRRAVTEYVITTEDAYGQAKFEDSICQTNYPVDVHGKTLNNVAFERDANNPRPYYEIPYRSLIVKGVDNLLVAGRCLGAEFVAQSSIRVIPTCRAMGEATGIGAALNISDGKAIREEMIRKGADFVR